MLAYGPCTHGDGNRDRAGDRFAVTYLQRGPEAWSLQFVHTGDDPAR